jgi:hypothetical protein
VARLRAAGVRAILVGETLMRAGNVAATIADLLGPLPTTGVPTESRTLRP